MDVYDEDLAVDSANEVSYQDLEAFFNAMVAAPAKPKLSPQERVEVRRQVEELLGQREYDDVYGDPFLKRY